MITIRAVFFLSTTTYATKYKQLLNTDSVHIHYIASHTHSVGVIWRCLQHRPVTILYRTSMAQFTTVLKMILTTSYELNKLVTNHHKKNVLQLQNR